MCYLCSNVTFPLRNKSLNPNHFFFFAELANSNQLSFVSLRNIVFFNWEIFPQRTCNGTRKQTRVVEKIHCILCFSVKC